MRAVAMFRRQKRGFRHAQGYHSESGRNGHPNENMYPKGRSKHGIDDQRQYDDQSANAHGEQCCGTITHIIAAEIKVAVGACVGKLTKPSEQGFTTTLRAKTKKGSLSNAGLPFNGLFWFHLRVNWCAPATPDVNGNEDGRARPRQRNANTKQRPQNRNAVLA